MKKYIVRQKYWLLLATLLTLICGLLSVMIIYIVQNLVDAMIESDIYLLKQMIFYLIIVLAGNFMFGYFSIIQETKISKRLHMNLKDDLFSSMLQQSYTDFKKTSIGLKLSVFENDINLIEEYYFNNIFVLVRSAIIFVVAVVFLFTLNLPMGILLLFCTLVIMIIPILLGKDIDRLSESYSDKKGLFVGQLKEYLEGIDVVHAYHIEKRVKRNYMILLKSLEEKLLQLRKKLGIYNQAMVTGNYIIITISFSVGGFMVIKNYISMGELIAITQVMNIIISPISEAMTALVEIKGSVAIRNKVENLIQYSQDKEKKIRAYTNIPFMGIECRNIFYTVNNSEFSLKNITLHIEPRKKYVILGSSGCGKTTLLKLIANIIEVDSGSLSINDIPYLQGEETIERLVSFVHQDTFIFNDTMPFS